MRKTRQILSCVCIVMLVLLAGGCAGRSADTTEEFTVLSEESGEASEPEGDAQAQEADDQSGETGRIFVYVCGQVCHPGVYELEVHSRVYEAIEAAGGMTQTAAFSYLNQAEEVSDGQRIYIPSEDEISGENESVSAGDPDAAEHTGQTVDAGASDDKVNLNTADLSELTSLTGIGETRAKAILQYRDEHGSFQSVEDLKNVEGIGEKTFRKLESQIKV